MRRPSSFILVFLAASLCVAQRLPQTVVPASYTLRFTPDFAKKNFDGDEAIQVRLLESSTKVVLHAVEIDFHEVTITDAGSTQSARVTLNNVAQTVTFTVDKALPAGLATIHIQYTGILNDQRSEERRVGKECRARVS